MLKPTYDSETKIWSGPKETPIFNPEQNLGQLIVRVLEQTPLTVTQVSADTGVEVTCGEMRERILKIASHLNGIGLQQGDVVSVIAGNTENLAPLVYACFLLGLPVNPLATVMVESDIVEMFSKTKPKLIFSDGAILETVKNAMDMMKSEAKIYTVMERVEGHQSVIEILSTSASVTDFVYPEVDPNSILIILRTSGSTGEPKGVVKSHKNAILECYPVSGLNRDSRNVLLQYSGIFWFSGFFFMIKGTLYGYNRVITAERYNQDKMIEIIDTYKVTHLFLPPFAIIKLLQKNDLKPFESMKWWMVGGAPISKELCTKFKAFVPNGNIGIGYGCSEQGMLTINKTSHKLDSAGCAAANSYFKIIDDNDNAVDNNQQGEICSKIPSKFLGYFNEPEKTNEAFDGEWFRTGDTGYFDDEGFVFIYDRKKEKLRYNNYPIASYELEEIINKIDGVAGSCIVGVLEEHTGNDIIHAFVIANHSAGLTESYIVDYVAARVNDAKRIRGGVHFVETFPLGLTGKIDKKQLRKIAAEKAQEIN